MSKQSSFLRTIGLVMVFLVLSGSGLYLFLSYQNWQANYQGKIYPQTKIGNIDIGGLSLNDAQSKISQAIVKTENAGLKLKYDTNEVTVLPINTSLDADASFNIFSVNADDALAQVANETTENFWQYLKEKWLNQAPAQQYQAVCQLDKDKLQAIIDTEFNSSKIAPVDASFAFKTGPDGQPVFTVTPERIGKDFDYANIFQQITDALDSFSSQTIILKTQTVYPEIYADNLQGLKTEAEAVLGRGNLVVGLATSSASSTITINQETIASWLNADNNHNLIFDKDKIAASLQAQLAPLVNQPEIKPRFTIVNNKVNNWQPGTPGWQLDASSSAALIANYYLQNNNNGSILNLIINKVSSSLTDSGNIIIKEIIGTGHSNFVGSSANRIKNIDLGAAAVNGLLIAPNEEFSLVKNLGVVDASTGYVPELVIKDNKTEPEYGGGLCQVATTLFRTALASGLPITERQNHSYRVSYYEPAGTDAAVYLPSPDVKFINDTGNYILIQSRINKNDIYFDFWGVKDGRSVSSTVPVIYNITPPPAPKITVTDTLKPGEKKCTESAHNGADAYFDYTVVYPDGVTKTKRFHSHYLPWQKVCLVGATSTAVTSATSTPLK
jgi:vancomycin resistance protein YoaR